MVIARPRSCTSSKGEGHHRLILEEKKQDEVESPVTWRIFMM